MGIYIVRHMKQQIKPTSTVADLQVYANDFCANAKDSLKERLIFLNELYTLDPSSSQFQTSCVDKLKQPSTIFNPWYLP